MDGENAPALGGEKRPGNLTGNEPQLAGQKYFLYVNRCPGGNDFIVLPKGYPTRNDAWFTMIKWFADRNIKICTPSSLHYLLFDMIPRPCFIAGTLLWGDAPKRLHDLKQKQLK